MQSLTLIALVCTLLLIQLSRAWNEPSSCGDGPEEALPTASRSSSPAPASSSGSESSLPSTSSSNGDDKSSDACDCSYPLSLVSASSVARTSGDEGSTSFTFDGTTSDIAQQLYNRYASGDQVAQMTLETVPGPVQSRLHNLSTNFEDLPGLLQRAILWDSGFAFTPDGRVVRVWTLDNRTMADIAISSEDLTSAGCEALVCADSNGETSRIYKTCRHSPIDLLAASKCVVDSFKSDEILNGSVWSTGGSSTMIPEIHVIKNDGITSGGCKYTIYSIHTAQLSNMSSMASGCPAGQRVGSLTIPCYGNDTIPDSLRGRITTPSGSDWVTRWILQRKESFSSSSQDSTSTTTEEGKGGGMGFSWWWLLIILLVIVLLIIATIAACHHCHRLSRFTSPPDNTTYIFVGGRIWAVEDETHGRGAGYWLRFVNWCRKTFNFFE
ncbi:unnamed protein product [Phytophthora fragariaefolia]|uniref:Unnamed protein product n=1 Tax=Phytophthora fragariaefolia TaxID=1490495 RepID=A0A9W6X4D3_9STRA|nr:unnamed protein product [Phytophthora fragariaefolia]